MTLTGYKGLPQGSVLSPSFITCLVLGSIDSSHRGVRLSNMRMTSLCTLRITFLKCFLIYSQVTHLRLISLE
jgi:hypothetical protein